MFEQAIKFGIAGNMTGHLEQAGEASDFTQVEAEHGAPKGMFPFHVPGHEGFLGVDPVSHLHLTLPDGEARTNVQAEPELALVLRLHWSGDRVERVEPIGFTAYNDVSIRLPAGKISHKKNWGPHCKGLGYEVVPLTELKPGGTLDRYHLASFLLRDGVLHDYGVDSPVRTYSYFHGELLTWIADRLNHQPETGPLEALAPLLKGHPDTAIVGVGATRYTAFAERDRLQPGDEVIVLLYDATELDLPAVREAVSQRALLPEGNPVLRQRVR